MRTDRIRLAAHGESPASHRDFGHGLLGVGLALWFGCAPGATWAHHSVAGFFNPNEFVEIEGVVTEALWRNPHTEFHVEATAPSGEVTLWRVETGALGILRTRGLDREFLQVGDRVRVRGDRSLRDQPEVFARNLLLASGKEVLLTTRSSPYFTRPEAGELLESVYDDEIERTARLNAEGIFRVWSTDLDEIPHSGVRMFHGDYPLTEEAEARRAAWDAGDSSLLECTEWNMPYIMYNPLPMVFLRQGDDMLLRFEEDDNERLIHMNADPGSDPNPDVHTLLGYSTGHWEGGTLVVATTNMAANVLDFLGTPFSSAIHLVERFTSSADGSRLDYRLTITDPETVTEPFEVERFWIWRPEIVVSPYECGEDQRLDAATRG